MLLSKGGGNHMRPTWRLNRGHRTTTKMLPNIVCKFNLDNFLSSNFPEAELNNRGQKGLEKLYVFDQVRVDRHLLVARREVLKKGIIPFSIT